MQPDDQQDYYKKDPETAKKDDAVEMYKPAENTEAASSLPDDKLEPKKPLLDEEIVHWSALENLDSEKGGGWFAVFWVIVVVLIAADILFIKSYSFSVLVAVMATSILVLSKRPSREIDYTLSGDQGLYIGEKLYHFSEFKSFGLINEDGIHSVMLIPIKRFSLGVSVYFPQESGEQIVDILGARLPMQELKLDIIDKIVRKLRL